MTTSVLSVDEVRVADKIKVTHKNNGDSFTFTVKTVLPGALMSETFGLPKWPLSGEDGEYRIELLYRKPEPIVVGQTLAWPDLIRRAVPGTVVDVAGSIVFLTDSARSGLRAIGRFSGIPMEYGPAAQGRVLFVPEDNK